MLSCFSSSCEASIFCPDLPCSLTATHSPPSATSQLHTREHGALRATRAMFAESVSESSAERNHAPLAPQGPNARNPRTCVTCKRRKVKCDRANPCSNCIKAQIPCKYPPPGRAPRQPRRAMRLPDKGHLSELVDQVWAMMARVMELSINPDLVPVKQSPTSDHSSQLRDSEAKGDPRSKTGGLRVVGMDKGKASKRDLLAREIAHGSGSTRTQFAARLPKGTAGRLVLEEGKSQYIPSPFWASMSDVCIV